MIGENKFGEAEEPVKLGQAIDSHAYTVDADGVTVEHVWENMSYADLRQVRFLSPFLSLFFPCGLQQILLDACFL